MILCHGINEQVIISEISSFSFYAIDIAGRYRKDCINAYVDLKLDVLYHMHGDRGISSMKYRSFPKNGHMYYAIVCVKDESEVIFKLKYENVKLLHVIPTLTLFDVYMESIDVDEHSQVLYNE